jgi:hypothetical protein
MSVRFFYIQREQRSKNMPRKSPKTVGERLSQYNISRERYDSEEFKLFEKGYSQEQSDRLILRQNSAKLVKELLAHHDEIAQNNDELDEWTWKHSHSNDNLTADTAIPEPA